MRQLPLARFLCAALFAAVPALSQQYAFQYYGVEQGLTNLAIKTMFQDRTGFIWVGTENGVFRYEGVRFREFSPEQGLPPSVSASIGEAPDGSVLVGNTSGLFRLQGERFERVALPLGTHINGYTGIRLDINRTWIATDEGLLIATVTPAGALNLQPGPTAPGPDRNNAQSVMVDGGLLWWGCGEALCRWNGQTVTVYGQSAGLKALPIPAMIRDREGNIWVEQNRRMFILKPGAARFEEADASLPLTGPSSSPAIDSDGRLLIPTTEGLAIREHGRFHILGRSAGLLPPLYAVLQDRDGTVWLGPAGRGLAKWLGYSEWESFSAQSGLTGETVYEILPTENGVVWAGSEGGFFRGHRGEYEWEWKAEKALGKIPVHAVQRDREGHLWLGTDGMGVARFDPKSGRVQWFGQSAGLDANSPNALLIDRDQVVWAGTEKGLFATDAARRKFHLTPDFPRVRCWALLQTPDGDIWAGTREGLWQRSGGKWRRFNTADGLTSDVIVSLAADPSGAIWVGYRLSGTITRFRLLNGRPLVTNYEPPPGRAVNITYFLGFDSQNRLWAGTNLGVQVRDAAGAHWERYDHHDGLIWDDCDLHAFAAEPDGHVWIGTSGGLSHFLPRAAPIHTDPPRSVITAIVLGRQEIDPAKNLALQYSSEPLIARFAALRFGRERDVTFRYRLDPLFTNWRETADRELQFPALPPGNYRLEVEARDSRSNWSQTPAAFAFTVLAPWWRTWWFIASAVLAVILMVALVWRRRTARDEVIRRALEAAVAERTSELSHQYRHDVLTGLPNRLLFEETLGRELISASRHDTRVAVLFIDLDRFKRINDTWGHQTGDEFLRQISEKLRGALHTNETIARIGGDEFIVLIPGLTNREAAETRGWDLLHALEAPVRVEGKNVFATMSVGIAVYPEDASQADVLMAAADAAMYRAKGAGKNQVQLFRPDMTEAASRPQNIEDRLREALKSGGFRLRYQPQYGLDGRITGFEALLRVDGAETDLTPGEFIPIAEESGLIVEMGNWVLREACSQARAWHLSGFPDARIAINVSVVQLVRDSFEETINRAIEETGIDPSRLELELTETALLKDTGHSASLLNRLREKGIQVALDDFGTGYSPMQYLHQLPVDVVKIDQVFVRDLDASPSSLPLVEGMVKLARTLSLRVVAEGVETRAQFEILRQVGFDAAQGNLLSIPVSPEKAEELLQADALVRT